LTAVQGQIILAEKNVLAYIPIKFFAKTILFDGDNSYGFTIARKKRIRRISLRNEGAEVNPEMS
jgi:hypothetical protein